MKRIPAFFLILALLVTPAAALEPLGGEAIGIPAPCAVLMEKTTGTVIFEKNARERCFPASVTKVMTMLLIIEAMEEGRIDPDAMVTASARASSMGGSQIWLEEGERMSVSEMLECVAVVSANDCAVALAEYIAGTEESFVQSMNRRAAELGMADTHFTNCTGLFDDDDHYTTAYDVALMARALISHDRIKEYTTVWMDTVRDGEFGLSNTNKLLKSFDGATGLKTGFTSRAMYCLAGTAERDGVEYIAVALRAATSAERFESVKTLLSYAFANYDLVSLRPELALPPVPVELGDVQSVQPVYDGPETLLEEKGTLSELTFEIDLPGSVPAPVEAGQKLGSLTVKSGDTVLAEIGLAAGSGAERLSFWDIWTGILGVLVGKNDVISPFSG